MPRLPSFAKLLVTRRETDARVVHEKKKTCAVGTPPVPCSHRTSPDRNVRYRFGFSQGKTGSRLVREGSSVEREGAIGSDPVRRASVRCSGVVGPGPHGGRSRGRNAWEERCVHDDGVVHRTAQARFEEAFGKAKEVVFPKVDAVGRERWTPSGILDHRRWIEEGERVQGSQGSSDARPRGRDLPFLVGFPEGCRCFRVGKEGGIDGRAVHRRRLRAGEGPADRGARDMSLVCGCYERCVIGFEVSKETEGVEGPASISRGFSYAASMVREEPGQRLCRRSFARGFED